MVFPAAQLFKQWQPILLIPSTKPRTCCTLRDLSVSRQQGAML